MDTNMTLWVKVLALLLLWFGLVGVSSALSVTDQNYVGGLARWGSGLADPLQVAPDSLTTAYVDNYHNTGWGNPQGNVDAVFSVTVSHLYSFSLVQSLELDLWMEFRASDPMTITFYDSNSVLVGSPIEIHFSGLYPQETQVPKDVVTMPSGAAWMLVEADPLADSLGMYSGAYEIRLAGDPVASVPLPPALLLFGSSLLGFITLGWRRSKA